MDTFQNTIATYFTVSLIVIILVILWMIAIVVRLGRANELLASIDRRLAGGLIDNGSLKEGVGQIAGVEFARTGDASELVSATYVYQGMKIEEVKGGGFVLHTSDGFEHFKTRRELDTFLAQHFPGPSDATTDTRSRAGVRMR